MLIPMKRLTLLAMKPEEKAIMKALQQIGAVQIISSGDLDGAGLSASEAEVSRLKNALAQLRPYAAKEGMLSVKPELSLDQIDEALPESLEVCSKLEELEREKSRLKSQKDKASQTIELLAPWADMSAKLEDIAPTRSIVFMPGLMETNELARLDELCDGAAYELYGGERRRAVLIACPVDRVEDISRALKDTTFTDVSFQKLSGTPSQVIEAMRGEIKAADEALADVEEKFKALGEKRDMVGFASDAAAIRRDLEAGITGLAATEATFILEGWVREDEQEKVKDAISAVTDVFYLETRDPAEDETPPSVVQNSKLVTPYEAVQNLYSRPDPKGIDGTPLMAPFYFLFFGMMLSDSGYGLVLTLGGLLYNKIFKPKGMTEGIIKVLIMGGISTMICGVFIGSFFGMDWNAFLGTPAGTFPLLFDPMTEPMGMLFLCFGLGLVHMLFGVCIKIVMCIKAKDYAGAIFDNVSWLLIVLGILVFALLPNVAIVGYVMAILGAAMVLLFAGRTRPNFAKRLIKGAGSLYDVTSYLSDVLSYARVFALGLSTGVIGNVLNTLGSMLYNGFADGGVVLQLIGLLLAAVFLVALHLFSLGINVLGCFVHCARLQYVEFYGKFYEAGGQQFTPLSYKTRRVRIR